MKTAIYIRVSTYHQIDKDSLPLQRQDLINYTKYILNINEYEIFEDAGYSAKNTDRPAFQEMMKKIRKKEFTHLLVWKIDRISRNLLDFCDMYNDLKKFDVTFISKNEQFDTSSAMGEAMLKIILVFAELERKLTGERVKSVMMDRANKGKWNGSPIPLGYKWNPETKFPEVDLEESQTISMIYENYKKLKSTTLVRKLLNNNGMHTKRNKAWTTKTIADIIRNPFYKGTYRYNFRESARGKKKKKDEWIIIDNNHQGIVTADLWEECNAIMDENAKRSNALFRGNAKTHVFASLIKCGECNNNYTAKCDKPHKDGYQPSLYVCSGREKRDGCSQKTISDKIVGTFVLQFIKNVTQLKSSTKLEDMEKLLLLNLDDVYGIDNNSIEELYNILHNKTSNNYLPVAADSEYDFETAQLSKEKAKYERALKRLDDLYLFDDDAISEKDYLLKKNDLKNALDSVNFKIKQKNIKSNDDVNFFKSATVLILKLELNKTENINYKDLLIKISKETMKEFINTVIKNIIVKDRKIISIEFKNGYIARFVYNK